MFYRRMRVPYSWGDMDRLQSEMHRQFMTAYPERWVYSASFPAVNAWANDDGLVITAEIPGVEPDDLDISVVNDQLTISGERKNDVPEENVQFHRQEIGYGKFSRTVALPFSVDTGKIEATFSNGVLRISLSRKEEDKPKKIKISLN